SQATAVTSGVIALMLEEHPDLTPDVEAALQKITDKNFESSHWKDKFSELQRALNFRREIHNALQTGK
ncbi:MAG: hypothetical protein AAF889_11035, partial [Cyanobacteria bacterium P01_D01_bin.73]